MKKIVPIIKGYGNVNSYLLNLLSYLLEIYDLEIIKELVQNYPDLMEIVTEADIYPVIADGFRFKSASRYEIESLFRSLPKAKEVFNNIYSEDERNLILSRNI